MSASHKKRETLSVSSAIKVEKIHLHLILNYSVGCRSLFLCFNSIRITVTSDEHGGVNKIKTNPLASATERTYRTPKRLDDIVPI
jgi:hypothetical protein